MRWSQTLVPTLKETPAEAEIISHKLLLRAGLIRKLTGGLYTFMPLGIRALRKVEQIVREEMNRAGGLELLMPALQPPEIWHNSGRYESAKDVLFMVPAETGENEIVICDGCGYAANVEKATAKVQGSNSKPQSSNGVEKFPTPGVVTIEALSKTPYNVSAADQIKTLVYMVESKPVLILVRGDDQLNEPKLA